MRNHAHLTSSHFVPRFSPNLSVKNDLVPTSSRKQCALGNDLVPLRPENHAQNDFVPLRPKVGTNSNLNLPMTSSHFPLSIEGKWDEVGLL